MEDRLFGSIRAEPQSEDIVSRQDIVSGPLVMELRKRGRRFANSFDKLGHSISRGTVDGEASRPLIICLNSSGSGARLGTPSCFFVWVKTSSTCASRPARS